MHHWVKSYIDFDEWVNFAYWWSCIGKGLRSTGLTRLVFTELAPRPCQSLSCDILGSWICFCLSPMLATGTKRAEDFWASVCGCWRW